MGWGGVGGLGLIIESNLNRDRLSCCLVGVGLGCDNNPTPADLDFPYIKGVTEFSVLFGAGLCNTY